MGHFPSFLFGLERIHNVETSHGGEVDEVVSSLPMQRSDLAPTLAYKSPIMML